MSTTSNSRADLRFAALLILAACATSQPVMDPEGPSPAAVGSPATKPPRVTPSPDAPDPDAPIELVSAQIHRAADVPELLARLRRDVADVSRLAVIDVRTGDLGMDLRDAYPAIVLNGRTLTDTRAVEARRLAAVVEVDALRGENVIAVTMIGDRGRTSRRTVTVRAP